MWKPWEGRSNKVSYTFKEKKELRRSRVRIWVTFGAAAYLFIFGPALVAFLLFYKPAGDADAAKDLFMYLVPVASGIIAYWFGARKNGEAAADDRGQQAPAEEA